MDKEHKTEHTIPPHGSLLDEVFSCSKKTRYIVIGLVCVIVALFLFQAGMYMGYRKASLSYRQSERYERMIEGPQSPMEPQDFSVSHGAAGKIVSVSLPSFVVASPDNREETVVIGDDTVIRMFRNTASTSDIRPDQLTVVLGDPDDLGNIQARFIRIMPPPNASSSTQPANY